MVGYSTIERMVRRMIAPIHRRTRLMLSRAVINLINDSEDMQSAQVDLYEGQTRDDVEHFQPLGLTSVPSKDAEGLVACVGGNQDHPILLGVQDRSIRPTGMSEGETKVYDKTGSYMHLKSNGDMALAPSGAFVHVGGDPADVFIAKADLTDTRINSLITAHNNLVIAFNLAVGIFNIHTHTSTSVWKPGTPGIDPTVTVAATTPPQVIGVAHVDASSVAASKGKVS